MFALPRMKLHVCDCRTNSITISEDNRFCVSKELLQRDALSTDKQFPATRIHLGERLHTRKACLPCSALDFYGAELVFVLYDEIDLTVIPRPIKTSPPRDFMRFMRVAPTEDSTRRPHNSGSFCIDSILLLDCAVISAVLSTINLGLDALCRTVFPLNFCRPFTSPAMSSR